jgi:2-polyprenyl-6-methoxyphenol hydroxylase-like FAD-dependent oxidoreductase
VLATLRDHAPAIHARVDPGSFGVARPLDVGHVAITPTVRRGYARLSGGRVVLSLGDAHVVMDPITGQGANKASHAALVVGAAIRDAGTFDEAFCEEVERRLQRPAGAASAACRPAARCRVAASGHRRHLWRGIPAAGRVLADRVEPGSAALLDAFKAGGPSALAPYMLDMRQSAASASPL